MSTKSKILIFIVMFSFVKTSFVKTMESGDEDSSYEIGVQKNSIEDLPTEILYNILKELIKTFVLDFMVNTQNIDPDEVFLIKNVRLINSAFKELVDSSKLDLVKLAVRELNVFDVNNLNTFALNNLLAEVLRGDCTFENEKKAALLIIMGANPHLIIEWSSDQDNQVNQTDCILIMISISGNFKNLINLLCRYGANIDMVDPVKGSPLIAATRHDQMEVVGILMQNDAYTGVTHDGLTALNIARDLGNEKIADLIFPPLLITKFFKCLEDMGRNILQ